MLSRSSRLRLNLSLTSSLHRLALGSAKASDTILLVLPKPGLLRIAEHAAGQEVRNTPDHDQHEGNRVEVVNGVAEDADADDDAPEVGRQHGDVPEGGAAHAQHDGDQRVEEAHAQREAGDVANDVAVPGRVFEGLAVEDGGLHAADEHAEEAQEGEEVVHGLLGDEPLLEGVAQAVEGCTEETEEVALDFVDARTAVHAGDVVRSQENSHAAAGDQDTDDLEGSVADLQEEEGEDDDHDDGPEVEQLRGQDVRVAVSQHGEVIALHIHKRHNEVLPAILPRSTEPLARPILDHEDGVIDEEQQDIVEDALEGGDAGAGLGEEAAEGVGGGDAQGKDLADGEDDPELLGGQVAVPVDRFGFDHVDALADGGVFGGERRGLGGVGGCGLEALGGLVGVSRHCVVDVEFGRGSRYTAVMILCSSR